MIGVNFPKHAQDTNPTEKIAVIIPTWNESRTIVECLDHVATLGASEIIVVDADSPDGTADLVRRHGTATVLLSARGRGRQQNLGANASNADILVFLHADCRLSPSSFRALREHLRESPNSPGGCFRMRIDSNDPRYRLIEAAANFRAAVLNLPYGDQCLFVRRRAFQRIGGFPEFALMDDLFLARRLRSLGRLIVVNDIVRVSARRWRKKGLVAQSLLNWRLTALAALGVHPNHLAKHYAATR